ncbi:pentapeptide repeat-containing protein [Bdellovibrio sp. 22V]|uniref:pentapeptide repeat-containing protein n=1 Tax=Bdellovibrio sp. 22V TaxID=3044166 RepID=UPI0025431A99|nr:pentapeptide repeat-containing protein [Bdellovibrio sp. 22V]WII71543.1 pentapeptide repeat-containing protein [Bdellovibrio sp. 22V]
MRILVYFGLFSSLLFAPPTTLGASLSPSPLSGQIHERFDFKEKPLAMAQIINATFKDSTFLEGTWFQVSLRNTKWLRSQLQGVRGSRVEILDVEFKDSNLSGFKCSHCLLDNVEFRNSKLDGSRFVSSVFKNVHFINVDLSRADFVSSRFQNCSMDARSAAKLDPEKIKKWNIRVIVLQESQ